MSTNIKRLALALTALLLTSCGIHPDERPFWDAFAPFAGGLIAGCLILFVLGYRAGYKDAQKHCRNIMRSYGIKGA